MPRRPERRRRVSECISARMPVPRDRLWVKPSASDTGQGPVAPRYSSAAAPSAALPPIESRRFRPQPASIAPATIESHRSACPTLIESGLLAYVPPLSATVRLLAVFVTREPLDEQHGACPGVQLGRPLIAFHLDNICSRR